MPPRRTLSRDRLRRAAARIARFQSSFDLLDDHVIITDGSARILYANAAAERATGFALGEMLGKNPADLWGGRMPKEFYRRMWRTIKREKKPFLGEVCNVRKDGSDVWQELRITPVLDEHGKVAFFIGVESVITDRIHREQVREDILSVVSHEALSPLASLRWVLERVLSGQSLSAAQRKDLRELAAQDLRVVSMVQDLAFLSRLGKGHPRFSVIDLGKELTRIARNAHVRLLIPKNRNYSMRAIPSLAREFFSSLLSAAAGGSCVLRQRGKNVVIIVEALKRGFKQPADTAIPALIARYLHWEFHQTTTKKAIRWIIASPPADRTRPVADG